MIGWIWRMIVGRFGCAHEWETVKIVRLTVTDDFGGDSTGLRTYLCCKNAENGNAKTLPNMTLTELKSLTGSQLQARCPLCGGKLTIPSGAIRVGCGCRRTVSFLVSALLQKP